MNHLYKNAILGGTFDHLHKGHRNFIRYSFLKSEKVTIGLATSNLFQKKTLYSLIENYKTRLLTLQKHLQKSGYNGRYEIIPIDDIYGSSLENPKIDAIFVATTGVKNAELINIKRHKKGYPPLSIVVVPMTMDATGNAISSTSIRTGQNDREGNVHESFFKKVSTLKLTSSLRKILHKPFGIHIKDKDVRKAIINNTFIICVGDVVTAHVINLGYIPNLSIFDLYTKRLKIVDPKILNALPNKFSKAYNKKGTINSKTAILIKKLILNSLLENKKNAIRIQGEEDLLTLPSILFAPLDSLVIYGMADGMYGIYVTEEIKQTIIKSFIKKFKTI